MQQLSTFFSKLSVTNAATITQTATITSKRSLSTIIRNNNRQLQNNSNSDSNRQLHTTTANNGLEEFFDLTTPLDKEPSFGRPWSSSELRSKSAGDLQKLWYILLKERNMLMTMNHDARLNKKQFLGKERMKLVRMSMARLKHVVGERDSTLHEPIPWADIARATGTKIRQPGDPGSRKKKYNVPFFVKAKKPKRASLMRLRKLQKYKKHNGRPEILDMIYGPEKNQVKHTETATESSKQV